MEKPVKSPEGKAFVADIMRRVGAEKPRDLSRMLGWESSDRETRLFAWARGASAPNHEGTLALLRLAGMLREEGLPEGAVTSSQPARLANPDDIARVVAEISKEMRAGFRKIDRRLQGLEQQRTAGDDPPLPKVAEA